ECAATTRSLLAFVSLLVAALRSSSFRLPPPPRSTLFPYTTLFRSRIRSQPDSQALVLRITGPRNDDSMRGSFEMVAEPSDLGAIAKVEFFANGIKLAEVTSAPYVFVWDNVRPGTYNLTTTVTDAAGASATSATV